MTLGQTKQEDVLLVHQMPRVWRLHEPLCAHAHLLAVFKWSVHSSPMQLLESSEYIAHLQSFGPIHVFMELANKFKRPLRSFRAVHPYCRHMMYSILSTA